MVVRYLVELSLIQISANPTLSTGVIAQKNLKLGPIGSCTQKNEVFLQSKVENGNYTNVKWYESTNYGKMQMP